MMSPLLLAALFLGPAQDTSDQQIPSAEVLADILAEPLLAPEIPLAQGQAYGKPLVPKVEVPADADAWRRQADRIRLRMLDEIVFRGHAAGWKEAKTAVEWLDRIDGGPGYHLRKLRYEALPGLWIPAILYVPDKLEGKVPVVLNVNGHDPVGKAAPYKQIRCINMAKRGMLALNVEWYWMGQLRGDNYAHYRLNQLDLCGASGVAPFFLAMTRAIDLLLEHPNADPQRVAVTGLSGGGWQTIFVSSLDTRVTLANPVAGYASWRTSPYHDDLGDSEQSPNDMGTIADYAHLTALRAPRPTLLTYNAKENCCFTASETLPMLVESASPAFALLGAKDKLRTHVNEDPGTHNFDRDNRQALYRMLGDFFYPDQPFDAVEIASDKEVKTPDDLDVPLPADNLDFQKLAQRLCVDLPRDAEPPAKAQLPDWRNRKQKQLAELVRPRPMTVAGFDVKRRRQVGAIEVIQGVARINQDWDVPIVELVPPRPKSTLLIFCGTSRREVAETARSKLEEGYRVLVCDPWNHGDAAISNRPFLFSLWLAALGERPLGLISSQMQALATWQAQQRPDVPVHALAIGPGVSLAALVTAALHDRPLVTVELRDSLQRLRAAIDRNLSAEQYPELFCFGLLEAFEIDPLWEMAGRQRVRIQVSSR